MIKHLIILSFTFLLISCGEEETTTKESPTKESPTKEETTTVANTQTATTTSDTMEEIEKVISEKAPLPEEPESAPASKLQVAVQQPEPKNPVVQETPNTEEGEVRGYNQEELAKMRQEKMRQEKMRDTHENSFLIYNGTSEYIAVESQTTFGILLTELFSFEKPRTYIRPRHCMRVHNRHLDSIKLRRYSHLNILTVFMLIGAVCEKSDCPHGDIFIGYKDDGGDKVLAVRSLRGEDSRTVAECYPLEQYEYFH